MFIRLFSKESMVLFFEREKDVIIKKSLRQVKNSPTSLQAILTIKEKKECFLIKKYSILI